MLPEYNDGWKITEIMPVNSNGVKTHRDSFVLDFDLSELRKRIDNFRNIEISDAEIFRLYNLSSTNNWNLGDRRHLLLEDSDWEKHFTTSLYRPLDFRAYYHSNYLVERPRNEVMYHMLAGTNLAFVTSRQTKENWDLKVSEFVIDHKTLAAYDTNSIFPLYLYPDTQNQQGNLFAEKLANFSPAFLKTIRQKLGYTPTPEAMFYYIYAIFHSPTYRQRYAEFLKIDFPRVHLTANNKLFKSLAAKGEELVELHLMKSKKLNKLITKIGGEGDNAVTKITYKPKEQRVYINKTRYFEGIAPEIWEFKIGGYQVLYKWLKDRKKAERTLSFDEVLHYQRVVVALKETRELMLEIDSIIPGFPIE